jgi:hypothetical protein
MAGPRFHAISLGPFAPDSRGVRFAFAVQPSGVSRYRAVLPRGQQQVSLE